MVVMVTDISGVSTVPLTRLMRLGVTLNTFDMMGFCSWFHDERPHCAYLLKTPKT